MNRIKKFLRKIIIKKADDIMVHRQKSNKEFTQENGFLNITSGSIPVFIKICIGMALAIIAHHYISIGVMVTRDGSDPTWVLAVLKLLILSSLTTILWLVIEKLTARFLLSEIRISKASRIDA